MNDDIGGCRMFDIDYSKDISDESCALDDAGWFPGVSPFGKVSAKLLVNE
ncbi:hypothetical protein [Rhodococcus sp. NPDC058521]